MHSKQGTIVFMILIFFVTISALLYSSLRTNAYFISIAREREQHEMFYQLARSLQNFALEKYADHLKNTNIITSKEVLFKAPWPDDTSGYEGYILLEKEKKGDCMITSLYTEIWLNKKVLISLKV